MRKNAAFIRGRRLIIFLVVPAAFIRGRRLFEGGFIRVITVISEELTLEVPFRRTYWRLIHLLYL